MNAQMLTVNPPLANLFFSSANFASRTALCFSSISRAAFSFLDRDLWRTAPHAMPTARKLHLPN